MLSSRHRLQTALAHQDGPVPVDFGATPTSGIHVSVVAALRERLGLNPGPVKVVEPYQMLGEVADDLKVALGIDVAGVSPPATLFGFTNKDWQLWRAPWGQEVLVPGGFVTSTEPNGDILIYPQSDRQAPPSGRIPASGYFADTIVRQPPIDESRMNPQDNLEEFVPLGADVIDYYRLEVERVARSGRGVVVNFGGTALGDIALVPAPFLKHPKGIRDIEEWYVSTVARPEYVHAVFAQQTVIALANLDRIRAGLGPLVGAIDAVFVCGTDFGTQTGTFCAPDTFRALWLPYYRQITGWIHAHTPWKCFKHSCGAIAEFMPLFIDAGMDIENPVQCSASGMEAAGLKRRFGQQIVFWGGGVDTQRVLPFGTPDEVRAQVLERCRIFAPGGGFVFNAIHNVQARTPAANVLSMFDAVRDYNQERT
ncbi:MAG: uroporphyrinogen decarboxylase family protein [bacterium]